MSLRRAAPSMGCSTRLCPLTGIARVELYRRLLGVNGYSELVDHRVLRPTPLRATALTGPDTRPSGRQAIINPSHYALPSRISPPRSFPPRRSIVAVIAKPVTINLMVGHVAHREYAHLSLRPQR